MDDDNEYSPALWDELRRVGRGRVGVLAVRMDVAGFLERPLYDLRGGFNGFDAGCALRMEATPSQNSPLIALTYGVVRPCGL